MEVIHISFAGPERWLSAGGSVWVFEDHNYCGPIVLTGKAHEPATTQPPEKSVFWKHINAWYQQGSRTQTVGDKVWCQYEMQLRTAAKE